MTDDARTMMVGIGTDAVCVHVTRDALSRLVELPGTAPTDVLGSHRALLTTITVGRAAAGKLGNLVVIDATDIVEAISHAGGHRISIHPTDDARNLERR